MEKLSVTLVLEMLGRPPEHIKEAINTLVVRLGSEKGVKITEKKIHEPAPVQDAKDLYTAFAEITAELDSITNYFGILFAYMPAHIEIVSPENLSLKNVELNELGNKLLARLHDYDAITKTTLSEKNFLVKKLYEVAPHLFKQAPSSLQSGQPAKGKKEVKKDSKPAAKKKTAARKASKS